MIGILIVTHEKLGDALIEAAQFILGSKPEKLAAVSIDLNENADKLRKKIADGIKTVKGENGVLILTDMFGGSPSNLSYSFLEEGQVEVLSGVNLPILIKAIRIRQDMPLADLILTVEAFGKKSISIASSILKGNKRGE
ncbi:PTS sugar transporter subunit IIA [Desulfosudis oleivorans]|uniref:PTS system fructose subfamily IIA component n=1 Tax=Desulfosudis oleivorans (strain DSM 6200 / JCM 39069 / Hxd3) TaxID=96561 RepID=A8ZTP8_DESOH|nr:PTS fructose transporter subunit IIA [Desulfosudis oleivorans]ABW66312.1 PTS system fructose subfamily IIA component [Desulfosudis oleivorans Hxd3]